MSYKILLSLFVCIQVFAQHQLTIMVDDAYTFERIPNAYVLLESPKGEMSLYQSDKNGLIIIDKVQGEILLSCMAKNYEALQGDFYINGDLTVKMLMSTTLPKQSTGTNDFLIDGKVRDAYTGQSIANAKIKFFDTSLKSESLKANSEGILKLPNDFFNGTKMAAGDSIQYQISADGYESKTDYYHYFPEKMYAEFNLNPIQAKKLSASKALEDQEQINLIKQEIYTKTNEKMLTARCPVINRDYIKVGTRCACLDCGSVLVMSLEEYVQKGLDDEWISYWHPESLKAGSVAYRTYGAYFINHPLNRNYDISDTPCKQKWVSTRYDRTANAAIETSREVLQDRNNEIAFTEYSAETNSLGQMCGNGNSGGSQQPCFADPICAGETYNGHGRGMCQWGSKRWADRGYDYHWILRHYYSPYGISACEGGNASPPDLLIRSLYTVPSNPCLNGVSRLYVSVKNAGGSRSNRVGYERRINGQIAFSGTIPELDPGEYITYYRSYRFRTEGWNRYCVYVNAADNEVVTINNSYCTNTYVYNCGKADIMFSDATLKSDQILAGENLDLEYDFDFEGAIPEESLANVQFRYYLSKDCSFSSDDVMLGAEKQDLFEEEDKVEGSEIKLANLKIPSEIKNGTYYVLIQADGGNTIAEKDETNNISCLKVNVNNELIQSESLQDLVKLSPNPAQNTVNLQYPKNVTIVKVEIFDTQGSEVKVFDGKRLVQLDLSDLAPNYYILKMYDDKNQSSILQLIKK